MKTQLQENSNGLNGATDNTFLLIQSLVKKLLNFKDGYSKKLIDIFNSFAEHKDYLQLHKSFSEVSADDNIKFHNRWDLNTRCLLLEVIYPA